MDNLFALEAANFQKAGVVYVHGLDWGKAFAALDIDFVGGFTAALA